MRLIMMGTGPFAVPTFQSLLTSPHSVLALVTRPSTAAPTRGKVKIPPNPMRAAAEAYGLPIFTPLDINAPEAHDQLKSLAPDLFVVCDYGQILSPETLSLTPLGGINLHGSLLPKYRGAAPIQWALWRGEQETGVSVIHMTPRLDAGPCLVQRATAIDENETAAELEPRLAELGIAPVHEAIALLAAWDRVSAIGTIQDPSLATKARRLRKNDGEVDWANSAEQIFRQFRAVQPWPGLYSYYLRPNADPLRVSLERLCIVPHTGDQLPGSILESGGAFLKVATGTDAIGISALQPAGKRTISAADFVRGYQIGPGVRFGSLKD